MPVERYVLDRGSLPLHAEFALLGRRALLDTISRARLSLATPWSKEEGAARGPGLAVPASENASLKEQQGEPLHFRGLHHLVFAWIGAGNFFSFDCAPRLPVSCRRKLLHAGSFCGDRPIAPGVLGSNLGVAPIHAGCLDKNGNGLLIAGRSGAGKSTLSAASARRGFSLISDDRTYLPPSRNGETPELARLPANLCIALREKLAAMRIVARISGSSSFASRPAFGASGVRAASHLAKGDLTWHFKLHGTRRGPLIRRSRQGVSSRKTADIYGSADVRGFQAAASSTSHPQARIPSGSAVSSPR